MTITNKIKEDWGTVVRFCKKHDININTFHVVIYGDGKSAPITNLLIKLGYIKNASELFKDNTKVEGK